MVVDHTYTYLRRFTFIFKILAGKVPVVCIAIEGGPNTIKRVYEAIECGHPVVAVAKSGRASNILAHAFKYPEETDSVLR